MKEILYKYKDIIKKYEILVWDSEPRAYRFKSIITFMDDSRLQIKDKGVHSRFFVNIVKKIRFSVDE